MRGISKEQQIKAQQKRCLELKSRLERGWQICEKSPDDKKLEDHWIDLLKQYEKSVFSFAQMGGRTGDV